MPTLTDNGDVFFTFFNERTALYCTRWPRLTPTTFGTMVAAAAFTVTTSYGRSSSRTCGMQTLQTRDGNTVASYAQYYYYGAGIGVITVNKRTNSAKLMYNNADSADGYTFLHWRDSGFFICQNAYNANGCSGFIGAFDCSVRTGTVSPAQVSVAVPDGYFSEAQYPFFVEVTK